VAVKMGLFLDGQAIPRLGLNATKKFFNAVWSPRALAGSCHAAQNNPSF
jgi:hypothetical protein